MNATRKIALLLAVVFLLPALFFSGYELSSFNKNEALIQDVYNKQLEALLFSVNQYSDDVLNRWISQMEAGVDVTTSPGEIPPSIANLLSYNSALMAIFLMDTVGNQPSPQVYASDENGVQGIRKMLADASWVDTTQIHQLIKYKKSGFQKVEALRSPNDGDENYQWLAFITQGTTGRPRLAGFVIDPEVFVEDIVGPRLQGIARDQFILSVIQKGSGARIYNTAPADSAGTQVAEALTREFWLLPDYALGIRTRGASIQEVINNRTLTNMLLLIAVDLALILAVVLVFINVKKEVQLAQNKSDFVSNVSHEIRTPLALISMFAETLEMGRVKSEEKKQEYYTIIHKEAHRLSGIVNKILNFSQAEANKKTLHIEGVHPDTEIREILKTYDYHLANKGFTYTLQECPDMRILADREAFVETVINLIDNAMKYSAEEKRIEISCRKDKGVGHITVKDHGVGIRKTDQKHIFDKFYRVPSGNLAKSRGTGLGLSLVKQLMDAQHGTVSVDSELGKGSTFTLTFPLEPST